METKNKVKKIWLIVIGISIILLAFHWFSFAPENLKYTIIGFNVVALILSAPCSLLFVPVGIAANHFLEISPLSAEGIYLNTFFLFTLGFAQWFWIARFWSPVEPQLQKLNLADLKAD